MVQGSSPGGSSSRSSSNGGVASGGSSPASPIRMKRLSSAFLSKLTVSPGSDGSGQGGASSGSSTPAFNSAAGDLSPVANPDLAVQQLLASLQQVQLSQKRELDWQAQFDALSLLRRVARHHPQALVPELHAVVVAASPAVDALRSIPARLALVVFQDLIVGLGSALDGELDTFVPMLLKRAGVVSVAGRDNFLAVEADKALSSLVGAATGARVAAALLGSLANTKSPDVKAKAATHLATCVKQQGRQLAAGGGSVLVGRLLRAAVGLLDEGSLEARSAAKQILREVRQVLDGPGEFQSALARLDCKTDKVREACHGGRPPLSIFGSCCRPPPHTHSTPPGPCLTWPAFCDP